MKRKIGGNIIGLIIALVILVLTGVIGAVAGVFEDISDVTDVLSFSPTKIFKVLIIITFLLAVSHLVKIIFGVIPANKGRTRTLLTVVSSLISYVVIIAAICWSLAVIGVNVSTIFAGVGIIALIIGFGAESLVADLVTGMFIIFENQFNVGDIIEVSGFRGTVDYIGIRTTSIRDAGGNIKIINNSNLNNILNRSDKKSVAISEVGVSYATDLREVDAKIGAILEGIKNRYSEIFTGEVKYLGVENLADSAVVLKFMAEVEEKDIFSGRRLLNKELKCAFDEAGFEIAFPQIDVHMKDEQADEKKAQSAEAQGSKE